MFILSLGADVDYAFRETRFGRAAIARVSSGDAVCFNAKAVFHAVEGVHANTPPFWPQLVPGGLSPEFDRLGLQMRCNG